jgi:hypothetical protein
MEDKTDGACDTYGEKRRACRVLVRKLELWRQVRRIILKWLLNKQSVLSWAAFIWLRLNTVWVYDSEPSYWTVDSTPNLKGMFFSTSVSGRLQYGGFLRSLFGRQSDLNFKTDHSLLEDWDVECVEPYLGGPYSFLCSLYTRIALPLLCL